MVVEPIEVLEYEFAVQAGAGGKIVYIKSRKQKDFGTRRQRKAMVIVKWGRKQTMRSGGFASIEDVEQTIEG